MKVKLKKRNKIIWTYFAAFLICFAGCSKENSSQANTSADEMETSKVIESGQNGSTENLIIEEIQKNDLFRINELSWPDPDLGVAPYLTDGINMQPGDFQIEDDCVWREVWLYDDQFQAAGSYLETLEAPYTEWKIQEIDDHYSEDGKEYFVGKHFSYDGKRAFCILRDLETNDLALGKCENEKVTEVMGLLPTECKDCEIQIGDVDTIYAYQKSGNTLYKLNSHMEVEKEYTFRENILGVITGNTKDDVYCYGFSQNSFELFDLSDHTILPENQEIGSGWGFALKAGEQSFYIIWGGKVFCYSQDQLQQALDFGTRDYPWEEIETVHQNADGLIQILGRLDGEKCFVQLEQKENSQPNEKQEIVLTSMYRHNALLKSISRFNRRNEKYHISVVIKDEKEKWEDYERRLQMDMSSGQGADLFLEDALTDVAGYAQNGYLEKVDDLLVGRDDLFQPVLEGGKVDEEYYGIPYDFKLYFTSYSASFADARNSFTIDDLMKTTEASGAEILQYAFDGTDIVLWYGLYDNDNTTYIDWENGISHLEEAPFKELLEFAYKYQDPQAGKHKNKMESEEGEYLAEGRSVATESVMSDVTTMTALKACFDGNPKMLGYPAKQGNGIYMMGRYLYVNSACECKEGVKAFLQFLISQEEQTAYAKYQVSTEESMGYAAYFPVQKDAFDTLLEYEKNNKERAKVNFLSDDRGLKYEGTILTEEEAKDVKWLVEHAKSSNCFAKDIQSMVEEELDPYFAGQRDVDETAKRLHNRVQLYLDERN